MKKISSRNKANKEHPERQDSSSPLQLFGVALKLGLTSFGGPIAHLGYFYDEYVKRRKWLTDKAYAELVAISQMLPGPASSQFGIAVGTMRGGISGGVASWIGFTLPSALIMAAFGMLMHGAGLDPEAGWLHGLKIVAVAIVAHAVLQMGQKLAADKIRATIALTAAFTALLWDIPAGHIIIILAAGIAGVLIFRNLPEETGTGIKSGLSANAGVMLLIVFAALLIIFPALRHLSGNTLAAFADSLYRTGALVFGGGHVILPLLEREVVSPGWVSAGEFLAGYGAAQALPGPLFTFAVYLGVMKAGPAGAAVALFAIFLPAFLLILGAVPLWSKIRSYEKVRAAVSGINAAVVGILLAALYNPLWTSSVKGAPDFALALLLYGMLAFWKLPPWVIVITGACAGALMAVF